MKCGKYENYSEDSGRIGWGDEDCKAYTEVAGHGKDEVWDDGLKRHDSASNCEKGGRWDDES